MNEESDSEPCSLIDRSADSKGFKNMSSQISEHVIGPMPVDDFLQMFLHSPNIPTLSTIPCEKLETLLENPEIVEEEGSGLYTNFIDAFQPVCPNFELKNTHSNPMPAFDSITIQPDICVFDQSTNDVDTYDPATHDNGEYDTSREDGTSQTETYFLKKTKAGRRTLGLITALAAAQQATQFRTHIFSILILPEHARLLRWDRSGVVVTERFLLSSPYLVEFFHLYNYTAPHARGIDISVSTPSVENASKARASLGIATSTPLVQLSLGSSYYITSRETYMDCGFPVGRSTRTFIAYSVSRDDKFFLKDSWRLDSQTPEHFVYDQLQNMNIPHIPTVVEGGDVLDHTTLTQDLLDKNLTWIRNPPKRLKKHLHYRLILQEIAAPLHSFSSTKLLVSAVNDAIKAHRAAYFDAGILHRDISPGNIMIYNNGGLLIDWDLSTNREDGSYSKRTGTWQFMSAHLQDNPTAMHDFIDDVESFIYVITWVSFRFAKHNMAEKTLNVFMKQIFDYAFISETFVHGGAGKLTNMSFPLTDRTEFDSPNLKQLLHTITKGMAPRYEMVPSPSSIIDNDYHEFLQKRHEKHLERLKDSTWLISTFSSALSSPGWPDGDGARKYDRTINS